MLILLFNGHALLGLPWQTMVCGHYVQEIMATGIIVHNNTDNNPESPVS
jgi:hypothetical protein